MRDGTLDDHLTVSEDRFHRLLKNREIETEPPLTDDEITALAHNRELFRTGEYELDDLRELGGAFGEQYERRESNVSALSKHRRNVSMGLTDGEYSDAVAKYYTAVRRFFDLLRPMLEYHTYRTSVKPEFDDQDVGPFGEHGLEYVPEFEPPTTADKGALSRASKLIAIAQKRLEWAATDFGLWVDTRDRIRQAQKNAEYWVDELDGGEE